MPSLYLLSIKSINNATKDSFKNRDENILHYSQKFVLLNGGKIDLMGRFIEIPVYRLTFNLSKLGKREKKNSNQI